MKSIYALCAPAPALALGLGISPLAVYAQEQPATTVTVRVLDEESPVAGARVSSADAGALTDGRGEARLSLPTGEHTILVEAFGFRSVESIVVITGSADTTIVIALEAEAIELENIIVSSTRTERRIEDEPIRVEVIGREEVEEKILMTPGDISMLLNETAGLRVQPTAPALGGAGVRIQGLRGRYAQILTDGLPLHGGQTGALGPLQIPPMDLAQVEVIKGAASALYGASAVGGVVNLISRRPADENEREVLLNQSTLGGTDLILWNSGPITDRWGYTVLGGAHRQAAADVDDDGWRDVPEFLRGSVRPRFFWSNDRGASAMLTVGAMLEDREGGTDGGTMPDGTEYVEALGTRRADVGGVGRVLLGGSALLSARGSAALQRHEHRFGEVRDDDEHRTAFLETALTGGGALLTWVAGLAVQMDDFATEALPAFDYTHTVPCAFGQLDYTPREWLALSVSGRVDRHSEFGTFFNPRLSALLRPAAEWTIRASAGTGYFAPTPFTDETEAVGLRRVVPPGDLNAERARTASLDIGRTFGPLEVNLTGFGSIIEDAVQARVLDEGLIELFNAGDETRTYGTETLARYHVEGLHVTATHVFMRASEPDPDGSDRRGVPLTPRHTAGIVAAWEQDGRGRVGVEFYFTGNQELVDNPYRTESESHFIVGFLAERRFGAVRLYLNAENIFDTRQTRHDSLVLPERAPEGRWTTDVWAPLDGRSFNGGIRWEF